MCLPLAASEAASVGDLEATVSVVGEREGRPMALAFSAVAELYFV